MAQARWGRVSAPSSNLINSSWPSWPFWQPLICCKAAFCLCPPVPAPCTHPGTQVTGAPALGAPASVWHMQPTTPTPSGAWPLLRHYSWRCECLLKQFMMLLSDPTIKDAFNQGAANKLAFPHFLRSEGELFPCSHSQIQMSHLGPGLRSICLKFQDPCTENRMLKSNMFRSASETFPKRAVADF